MNTQKASWIEINQSALHHNIKQFTQWLGPNTTIAGVVKSNAYGHGIKLIASLYDKHKDITHICVVTTSEGVMLRKSGIKKPIIVIGYCDTKIEDIVTYNLQMTIYNLNFAQELNQIAQKHDAIVTVHIKIDTGLSRLGIFPQEVQNFMHATIQMKSLSIGSLFSHFSQGENQKITHQQEDILMSINTQNIPLHAANSHASMTTKYKKYSIARIGLGLYGYLPGHDITIQKQLQPIMSLKTKIIHIKTIQQGQTIGYDQTFTAQKNMTIAIIPFGYFEGFNVRLSNKGHVIVNGQLAPICGRISMNLTVIDVSSISNCSEDTIVTILGAQQNQTYSAYDWAKITNSSPYELITKINQNIARYIVEK